MNKTSRGSPERGHVISGFFVFCLIGLFAILATTLTLVGINAYRNVHQASTQNSEGQIALSYLLNKLHAYDQDNGVSILTVDGEDVLCLRETLDGTDYETRIYYANGQLCEYFSSADEPFDPDMGEPLTNIAAFHIRFEKPWLLAVDITQPDGDLFSAHMALRSEEATAP